MPHCWSTTATTSPQKPSLNLSSNRFLGKLPPPKMSLFFPISRSRFRSFFSLSHSLSLGVFLKVGALECGRLEWYQNQISTKRRPEREHKIENGSGRGKKARNFGPPPFEHPWANSTSANVDLGQFFRLRPLRLRCKEGGRGRKGAGKFGSVRSPCSETQCKRSINANKVGTFLLSPSQMEQQNCLEEIMKSENPL